MNKIYNPKSKVIKIKNIRDIKSLNKIIEYLPNIDYTLEECIIDSQEVIDEGECTIEDIEDSYYADMPSFYIDFTTSRKITNNSVIVGMAIFKDSLNVKNKESFLNLLKEQYTEAKNNIRNKNKKRKIKIYSRIYLL